MIGSETHVSFFSVLKSFREIGILGLSDGTGIQQISGLSGDLYNTMVSEFQEK